LSETLIIDKTPIIVSHHLSLSSSLTPAQLNLRRTHRRPSSSASCCRCTVWRSPIRRTKRRDASWSAARTRYDDVMCKRDDWVCGRVKDRGIEFFLCVGTAVCWFACLPLRRLVLVSVVIFALPHFVPPLLLIYLYIPRSPSSSGTPTPSPTAAALRFQARRQLYQGGRVQPGGVAQAGRCAHAQERVRGAARARCGRAETTRETTVRVSNAHT
jgi:hypothetical protein